MTTMTKDMPDQNGYFGEYGGQIIPPPLVAVMNDINAAYDTVSQTEDFQNELNQLFADFVASK